MEAGTFVLCIDDSNWDPLAFVKMSSLPVKGKVYQVRRVIPDFTSKCGNAGIALEGIYGDWSIFTSYNNQSVFEEYHFRMNRFREIETPILELEMKEAATTELCVV